MAVSLDEIREFASREVFPTLPERYAKGSFSAELWGRMGELGLPGMTVPERYGGSGGTPVELAESLREFTRAGCDLGMSLCWISHVALCVKSIEEFGSEKQKEEYLPRLASGRWLGAAAISEPRYGAHPAGIESSAVETPDGFNLSGKKLFITGGPVADLLVVLAATGTQGESKELTAFLVETDSGGVEIQPMELNFVKTAPHGEITFKDVELGPESVLAGRGCGHSKVSKTAFARERSAVTAAMSGLFAAAVREVADRYRQRNEGLDLEGKEAGSWIHHLSALEVYRLMSNELVDAAFHDRERWLRSIDLLIYLGLSYGKWGFWLGEFVADKNIESTFPLDILLGDMKLAYVDEELLFKEGRKRYIR